MMLTEAEARTKFCLVQVPNYTCLASDCMAWRYRPHPADDQWIEAVRKASEEIGDTSPNRMKAAKHVSQNRAKYGLPVIPTHGWCGLAGKP
jgi:hypothetical protein